MPTSSCSQLDLNQSSLERGDAKDLSRNPPFVLCGWVDSIQLEDNTFILRADGIRYHISCLNQEALEVVRKLKPEYVVAANLRLIKSSDDHENCSADALSILNTCDNLPFRPATREGASPNIRARYRYLEFRDPVISQILKARHRYVHEISRYLDENGFISIETPILANRSGTGAREFCVQSVTSKDVSYSLPQSAQTYGQLIIVGGIERYYQWSRCFRDEDLRANRQPEFTQLHLEMAFVDQDTLMVKVEEVIKVACKALGRRYKGPIRKISYEDSKRWYGTDQPDLRYDVSCHLLPYSIKEKPCESDVNVLVTHLPEAIDVSPEDFKLLQESARPFGFRMVGFLDSQRTSFRQFVNSKVNLIDLVKLLGLRAEYAEGLAPIWVGQWKQSDNLRRSLYSYLKQRKNIQPGSEDSLEFVWVVDYPLFTIDQEIRGKVLPHGHPFTAPDNFEKLYGARKHKDLLDIKGQSFDLVLNGEEVGSGSILIHEYQLQKHVLSILGYSRGEIREQFGFLLDALQYGAPPMGGFGLGADRLLAKLLGREKIREVIAFPKTKQGYCPVTLR